jgi:putative flippase GtrA
MTSVGGYRERLDNPGVAVQSKEVDPAVPHFRRFEWPAIRIALEGGRLFRFGLTGMLATLAYAGSTIALVESELLGSVAAAIVGYLAGAAVSYFGHLHFSFRVQPDHKKFVWRFVVTAALTFCVTALTTYLTTDILHWPYQISIAAVVLLNPAIGYLCFRLWVFFPGLHEQPNEQP